MRFHQQHSHRLHGKQIYVHSSRLLARGLPVLVVWMTSSSLTSGRCSHAPMNVRLPKRAAMVRGEDLLLLTRTMASRRWLVSRIALRSCHAMAPHCAAPSAVT